VRVWAIGVPAVAVAMLLACPLAAQPANCRFYFAAQHQWGQKLGFYLNVEGCELGELRFILGVADGESWRFLVHVPPFEAGRKYRGKAVVAPERAELWLDGELVAEDEGGFVPASGAADANVTYPWSADLGDYMIVQEDVSLVVTRQGEEMARVERSFAEDAARPLPLQLFERGTPWHPELDLQPGDMLTIETTFRTEGVDLRSIAPLIDRYGQCRYADWPEKVTGDTQLQEDIAREETALAGMPPSDDFGPYGGLKKAGWPEEATGFFHLARRDGYWWLVTPEGNPCFYLGVCAAPTTTWPTTPVSEREFLFEWLPPREAPWNAAWSANHWGTADGTEYLCYYSCNLVRKYGAEAWQERNAEQAIRRLRAWGFGGGGKWGAPPETVQTPVLWFGNTPKLAGHPDVFDPAVREAGRRDLEEQIASRRESPHVLGWSLGNEYDEIIKPDEVRTILARPADVPAKRALVDHAIRATYGGNPARAAAAWKVEPATREGLYGATPEASAEDIETLRQFYQDRYYAFIYQTVKEIDPNHLYLGNWIVPNWWENEDDWRIIARHCDVIGFDRYAPEYENELVARLAGETEKPILCGEFSFPAWYGGLRGFGRYHTYAEDDAHAGELYDRWVRAAASDPYCVGLLWFHYRDQPLTGRGPGRGEMPYFGEHFAFGLITETDRPKWDMVRRMREVNLQAARLRMRAPGAKE
jgi:hypothetical protein